MIRTALRFLLVRRSSQKITLPSIVPHIFLCCSPVFVFFFPLVHGYVKAFDRKLKVNVGLLVFEQLTLDISDVIFFLFIFFCVCTVLVFFCFHAFF